MAPINLVNSTARPQHDRGFSFPFCHGGILQESISDQGRPSSHALFHGSAPLGTY